MGTFTPLLVRTLRRTSHGPSGRNRLQIRHTHLGLSSLTPLGFIPAALLITDLFLESNQITEY
jgi:hypothetical protein